MFRTSFFIFCTFWAVTVSSQSRSYFIGFTDRNNSPYSIAQPQQFLSQRAIDRRNTQGITIVADDLPVNPSYVSDVASLGATVLNSIKWFNGITVSCDSNMLSVISSLPFVRQAFPVKRMTSVKRIRNKFESEGLLHKTMPLTASPNTFFNYGDAFRQIDQLNGDFLHAAGFTGQGMLIAAIDAGFNSSDQIPAFDSAFADGRILATWDFVDRQPGVYEDDAHGTSVLSCMASLVAGSMVGTAPHADFLLLRSEDANTEYLVEEYNWAAAAAFADSAGADLITSSLGYFYFDDGAMDHSYADMDGNTTPVTQAADIAAAKGILVLNSAGNTGNSSWRYVIAPADADSILSVGAVDSSGWKAGFSAWGPSSDGRVKPDVAAMGASTCVSSYTGSFVRSNGTSFSCPVLAGAAACLWQAHPGKTNMEVLEAIRRSANYFQTPGDSLGYGVPDMQAAHLSLGGTVLDFPDAEGVVELYPNPVSDRFTIGFYSKVSSDITIRLLDATGKVVLVKRTAITAGLINRIDIAAGALLSHGIYLVEVESRSESYRRKLVVAE